ncbi:glycerophosphoryl diester phosphodiesterase membrane domain-containing protein, partial [Ruminococcaceae bacterium OttesenSCG-928-I18]|nr:glycerophosphoryl diester phosphodiesterase membrane domain-containing protein [Ruminococcaceae bacterium OttesenSCG-928-I18]
MKADKKQKKLPLGRALGVSLRTVFSVLPGILLFEVVYKLFLLLVLRPLLGWMVEMSVALGGQTLVFNEQISHLLLSPRSIVGALVTVLFAAVFIYFEFSVIIWMAYYASKKEKVKIRYAMKMALLSLRSLVNPGFFGFCVYA